MCGGKRALCVRLSSITASGYWMPAWLCAPAANADGCSLPWIPAVTCAVNGAARSAKRRQERISTANPKRKNTSRRTSVSICSGTTASKSWKRTMPRRNRSKGQKPLSGQFRKEAGQQQKADSERGFIYSAIYQLDDRTRTYYSGNLW